MLLVRGCMWRLGADRSAEPVRSFGTLTTDLHRLADWFAECGVEMRLWS